jgi:hypothetical protein
MHGHDVDDDDREWDQFYAANGDGAPLWSGRPNGTRGQPGGSSPTSPSTDSRIRSA